LNQAVSITEVAIGYLESDEVKLPVYPKVALRIQQIANDPAASSEHLARVLACDPSVSAQILKAANSSFYGGLASVDNLNDAVVRLGLNSVVEISVMCAQRDQYKARTPAHKTMMDKLWLHAVATAYGGRWIAAKCGLRTQMSDAFMAGLFHDIGRLAVIQALETAEAEGRLPGAIPEGLFTELVDRLHTDMGARLIEHWNLAPKFSKVARAHHDEHLDSGDTLLAIVRLADNAAAKLGFDVEPTPDLSLSATDEADHLQLDDIAIAEMLVKLEDGMKSMRR